MSSKLDRSASIPIRMHRSASQTPSMMVNAKKFLSDRPQLLDCPDVGTTEKPKSASSTASAPGSASLSYSF
ncbi:hypothetical protein L596_010334 [Steinernema carpocapsae]|uniref:Uncharacterized protein n=1 Tax=Steinernema carpocapsae TaxID=34508 RepID=A0A4U5PIR4_STECR|nr:hypothetical protein L596_010334 [Steinernema carpocapsae]